MPQEGGNPGLYMGLARSRVAGLKTLSERISLTPRSTRIHTVSGGPASISDAFKCNQYSLHSSLTVAAVGEITVQQLTQIPIMAIFPHRRFLLVLVPPSPHPARA